MKYLNGELLEIAGQPAFVLDGHNVLRVHSFVDVYYGGPDRSRFNKIGFVAIKSIQLDPPQICVGHPTDDAAHVAVLDDQTIHIHGTLI